MRARGGVSRAWLVLACTAGVYFGTFGGSCRAEARPLQVVAPAEGAREPDDLDAPYADPAEDDPLALRGIDGPAIAEVLAAAYAAAGLDRAPARGWIRRARLAGLVPWVSVRAGRDASWQTDDPAIGQRTDLEVRATWRLDRLVFDGRELQVASIEAARRRERRELASRVIRAYFAWRRAAARGRGDEPAAELDALTDGWFSDAVADARRRPRRSASERRTAPGP